jgi:hypothetical protein
MGVRPRSIALGNACFGVAECLKIGRKSLTNRDIIRLASLCIVKQRFRPAYRRITGQLVIKRLALSTAI